jgi:hypothetical protein
MKRSKSILVVAVLLLALGLAAPASALPITAFTATSGESGLTQTGRLFRTGVPSEWSSPKPFPGTSGTAILNYTAYTLLGSMFDYGLGGYAGFVQVSIDDPLTSTLGSAYKNLYDPSNMATNYLGDMGSSGNVFGFPRAFQIYLAPGDDLVLLFNNLSEGVGQNDPLGVLVEGFVDTQYTDPIQGVPDTGSSLLLLGMSLAGLRAARRHLRK